MTSILIERTRKEQVLMYHGTSSRHLRSILKNGIIPDPRERYWNGSQKTSVNDPSKESIPNSSYWTTNLFTAYSSGSSVARKIDGERIIIIAALLMPESMFADEDDICHAMEDAIARIPMAAWGIFDKSMQIRAILDKYPNSEILDKIFDNVYEFLLSVKNLSHKTKKPSREFFAKWLNFAIDRVLSYHNEYSMYDKKKEYAKGFGYHHYPSKEEDVQIWNDEWFQENVLDNIPDQKTAEKNLIRFYDDATRVFRNLTRESRTSKMKTARISEPVTFAGRNKITCIVEIVGYEKLVVHYGDMPQEMLSTIKERISDRYEIVHPHKINESIRYRISTLLEQTNRQKKLAEKERNLPNDEYYNFVTLRFNVSKAYRLIKKNLIDFEEVEIDVDEWYNTYYSGLYDLGDDGRIVRLPGNFGVFGANLDVLNKMSESVLDESGLVITLEFKNRETSTIIIDGNHRLIRKHFRGDKKMKVYYVNDMLQIKYFAIDDFGILQLPQK